MNNKKKQFDRAYEKVTNLFYENAETLSKLAVAYYRNPSIKLREAIIDLYYSMLEEIAKIVIELIKQMFGIEVSIDIIIDNLTYDGDGKTLRERVYAYLAEVRTISASYFVYCLVRILRTETFTVYNKLIYNQLKDLPLYVEITHADSCCAHCEEEYDGGIFPIGELKEIPPFHPDCECSVNYYFEADL